MIQALLAMYPKGLYDLAPDSNVRQAAEAEALSLAELDSALTQLLSEGWPQTADELLTEWEVTYQPPVASAARNEVLAAWVGAPASLAQSHMLRIATLVLGYEPELRETMGFQLGQTRGPGLGEARLLPRSEWARWSVRLESSTGQDVQQELQRLLNRLKPAHSEVAVAQQGTLGTMMLGMDWL